MCTRSRRIAWWAERVAALVLVVSSFACGADVVRPRNVVVIAIDGLRRDEVGAWGGPASSTPTIDALARAGVRFDAAYSCAPSNVPSVAALWTGATPWSNGVRLDTQVLAEDALCLPEVLQSRGYATLGVAADYRIGRARGLDQGFETLRSVDIDAPGASTSQLVVDRACALLDLTKASERPYFLFVHFADPKAPLRRHAADGETIPSVADISGGESLEYLQVARPTLDAAQTSTLRALYSGEVREVDRAIARLRSHLEKRGELDDTVLVVVGTAGYEWNDRAWIGDGHSLHEELVRVPLLIQAPGWPRDHTHREVVSLAGLAQTIVNLAGCASDAPIFETPAFGTLGGPERRSTSAALFSARVEPQLFGARARTIDRLGVRKERWKLIVDVTDGSKALFDVSADPGELENLATSQPERVAELEKLLRAKVSPSSPSTVTVGSVESDAALRHNRGNDR